MALSRSAFEYVRDLLAREVGLVLGEDRFNHLEAQLIPLAQTHRAGSANALIQRLTAGLSAGLQTDVIDALVSSETWFFRDMRVFEYLRTNVLPELEQQRSAEKKLRIWSAACATGQEPFSVAMLIQEHFPQFQEWKIEILASDVSHRAVERAQQGRFDQLEINRGLPALFLVKYSHQDGSFWYLVDEIFSKVQFQEINLLADWPALPEMDLILLRNVLSEMNSEARKEILARTARHLKRDGYLIVGAQESMVELNESFRSEESGRVVVYRLPW